MEDNEYNTNYGDVTAQGSSAYSRITAKISIERKGIQILVSSFLGFYLSFILVFITYCMGTHKMGGTRIGLAVAAVFAAIGNKNSVDGSLPVTSDFTIADAIQLSSFSAIIFAIAVAVLIMWFEERHPRGVKVFNFSAAALSLISYVGFIGSMVIRATR